MYPSEQARLRVAVSTGMRSQGLRSFIKAGAWAPGGAAPPQGRAPDVSGCLQVQNPVGRRQHPVPVGFARLLRSSPQQGPSGREHPVVSGGFQNNPRPGEPLGSSVPECQDSSHLTPNPDVPAPSGAEPLGVCAVSFQPFSRGQR